MALSYLPLFVFLLISGKSGSSNSNSERDLIPSETMGAKMPPKRAAKKAVMAMGIVIAVSINSAVLTKVIIFKITLNMIFFFY